MKRIGVTILIGLLALAVPVTASATTGKAGVTVEPGTRTLDRGVTSINFGKVPWHQVTLPVTLSATLPAGAFVINDYSGATAGWTLSMAVEPFTNGSQSFDGSLTINDVTMRADSTQHGSATLFRSKASGYWRSPAVTAMITVPVNSNDDYAANVLYTLNNGVAQ